MCRLKQSNYNFYQKLCKVLKARILTPCTSDNCIFVSKYLIVLACVDDVLIFSKNKMCIDIFIKSLSEGDDKFEFTGESNIDNSSYDIRQPHLIQCIINELKIEDTKTQKRPTPVTKPLLHNDLKGKDRVKPWNYHLLIRMLTYLQGILRPNILIAFHQCTRFSANSMLSYEWAVTRIGRYLIDTEDKGLTYKVNKGKGLECFVNANFAGGWNPSNPLNSDNVLSRTEFVILHAGVPIFWRS